MNKKFRSMIVIVLTSLCFCGCVNLNSGWNFEKYNFPKLHIGDSAVYRYNYSESNGLWYSNSNNKEMSFEVVGTEQHMDGYGQKHDTLVLKVPYLLKEDPSGDSFSNLLHIDTKTWNEVSRGSTKNSKVGPLGTLFFYDCSESQLTDIDLLPIRLFLFNGKNISSNDDGNVRISSNNVSFRLIGKQSVGGVDVFIINGSYKYSQSWVSGGSWTNSTVRFFLEYWVTKDFVFPQKVTVYGELVNLLIDGKTANMPETKGKLTMDLVDYKIGDKDMEIKICGANHTVMQNLLGEYDTWTNCPADGNMDQIELPLSLAISKAKSESANFVDYLFTHPSAYVYTARYNIDAGDIINPKIYRWNITFADPNGDTYSFCTEKKSPNISILSSYYTVKDNGASKTDVLIPKYHPPRCLTVSGVLNIMKQYAGTELYSLEYCSIGFNPYYTPTGRVDRYSTTWRVIKTGDPTYFVGEEIDICSVNGFVTLWHKDARDTVFE
jgi:hypothetical protein